MRNLESVAQKMAELLHQVPKRTFRAEAGGGRGGGAHYHQWIIQSKLFRRPIHSMGRLYISRCVCVCVSGHLNRFGQNPLTISSSKPLYSNSQQQAYLMNMFHHSLYSQYKSRKLYSNKQRSVPQNGIFFKMYLIENKLNLI